MKPSKTDKYQSWRKMRNGHQKKFRRKRHAEVIQKLGGQCACCGSCARLQVDHVTPVNSKPYEKFYVYKSILEGAEGYQVLCQACNRWKNNGPRCPCHWWDSLGVNWRAE